jgi:hypothetical protein
MPVIVRHSLIIAVALMACGLGGCGTINGHLANGAGDYIPQWLGGLPPDVPPRPGTPQYDEYVREKEQRRLEPAPAKAKAAKPGEAPASEPATTSSLDPVH